jgi:hypothetical protein
MGLLIPSSHSYCVAGSHKQPPSAPAPLELPPSSPALCDALARLPLPPSDVSSPETPVVVEGPLEEHAATKRHDNQLNRTITRIGSSSRRPPTEQPEHSLLDEGEQVLASFYLRPRR